MGLEELAGDLRSLGLDLVAGISAIEPERPPDVAELAERLARCREPRLAACVIPLILQHPARAVDVTARASRVQGPAARELKILYTAAASLQRCWLTRLGLAGLDRTPIPDVFSGELGLPGVDEMHGRLCLRAIDDISSSWDGALYAREADAHRILETFLAGREHAPTR